MKQSQISNTVYVQYKYRLFIYLFSEPIESELMALSPITSEYFRVHLVPEAFSGWFVLQPLWLQYYLKLRPIQISSIIPLMSFRVQLVRSESYVTCDCCVFLFSWHVKQSFFDFNDLDTFEVKQVFFSKMLSSLGFSLELDSGYTSLTRIPWTCICVVVFFITCY